MNMNYNLNSNKYNVCLSYSNDVYRNGDTAKSSFLLENMLENLTKDPNEKVGNEFADAIEAYKDEMLTGLTKEEREKIKEELEAYMDKNGLQAPEDNDKLLSIIEGLLKKYGFKGDIEEYAGTFLCNNGKEDNSTSIINDEQSNKIKEAFNQLKAMGIRI